MKIIKAYITDKENWYTAFFVSIFALIINLIFFDFVSINQEHIILAGIIYIIFFTLGFMTGASLLNCVLPSKKYKNIK